MLLLGIILTGLGFVLTAANLFFFFRKLPRRKLEADLVFSASLIKIGDEVKTDVEVLYKKEKVENIHRTVITLRNLGNKEISDSNIIKPIVISLPDNAIIDFDFFTPKKDFEPTLILNPENPGELHFRPNYMESGDEISIALLSIGKESTPEVTGVVGPPRYKLKLEEKREFSRQKRKGFLGGLLLTSLFFLIGVSFLLALHYAVDIAKKNYPNAEFLSPGPIAWGMIWFAIFIIILTGMTYLTRFVIKRVANE
ncbi:MAG TPA: hypothetical protein VMX79_04670 [bacterium]|nr:hypothetical protein [bacterium]